jgi:CHAT domain-containing protein
VRILAFGDPTFPEERASGAAAAAGSAAAETFRAERYGAEVYRSAFDSAGGLPRLRASADEARRVARYAPEAEVRLRERASAAFLKHAPLGGYRVIHFATHALVDERTGARTALALAPGEGESGFVGAGDLAALRMGADLVVLSACRSARGKIVEGEGVQGLTGPLLQAGARAVVATSWRIGDRATVAFMDDFYRAMAGGLAATDALRAAKLDAIRRGAPPREWAAFTLVGDPLVTVPLRVPPPAAAPWRWLALLSAVVVALGAAAYGRYGRRWRAADDVA